MTGRRAFLDTLSLAPWLQACRPLPVFILWMVCLSLHATQHQRVGSLGEAAYWKSLRMLMGGEENRRLWAFLGVGDVALVTLIRYLREAAVTSSHASLAVDLAPSRTTHPQQGTRSVPCYSVQQAGTASLDARIIRPIFHLTARHPLQASHQCAAQL